MPPDRALLQRNFAEAQDHVLRGMQIIARQHEIIAELERDGHDTARARKLLDQFEQTQALHMAHRDRLRQELDRDVPDRPGRSI